MTDEKELKTLEKVETLVRIHPQFDEEDLQALKKIITLVKELEALGSFASFIKTTVIWFGIIIGAFIAIKNGAVEFILGTLSNK